MGFLLVQIPRARASPPPSFKMVSMYPGEMELTHMPWTASSAAMERIMWTTAALETL